jgi:uncharacterized membrane protein YdjX (TVP38/TMEM64 family)
MTRRARLAAVLLFLLILWAAFRFSGLAGHLNLPFLQSSFEHHRLGGLFLFCALFALGNLVQIPGWIFLAAAVLALGRSWGGLATYAAACISCAATFVVIRLLGADALREFEGRWSRLLFARLDAHPVQSVFLLRLMFQTAPALNTVLALSGVGFRDYLLGTVLGLPLPIALYCVFIDTVAHWFGWGIAMPH